MAQVNIRLSDEDEERLSLLLQQQDRGHGEATRSDVLRRALALLWAEEGPSATSKRRTIENLLQVYGPAARVRSTVVAAEGGGFHYPSGIFGPHLTWDAAEATWKRRGEWDNAPLPNNVRVHGEAMLSGPAELLLLRLGTSLGGLPDLFGMFDLGAVVSSPGSTTEVRLLDLHPSAKLAEFFNWQPRPTEGVPSSRPDTSTSA